MRVRRNKNLRDPRIEALKVNDSKYDPNVVRGLK